MDLDESLEGVCSRMKSTDLYRRLWLFRNKFQSFRCKK